MTSKGGRLHVSRPTRISASVTEKGSFILDRKTKVAMLLVPQYIGRYAEVQAPSSKNLNWLLLFNDLKTA